MYLINVVYKNKYICNLLNVKKILKIFIIFTQLLKYFIVHLRFNIN